MDGNFDGIDSDNKKEELRVISPLNEKTFSLKLWDICLSFYQCFLGLEPFWVLVPVLIFQGDSLFRAIGILKLTVLNLPVKLKATYDLKSIFCYSSLKTSEI